MKAALWSILKSGMSHFALSASITGAAIFGISKLSSNNNALIHHSSPTSESIEPLNQVLVGVKEIIEMVQREELVQKVSHIVSKGKESVEGFTECVDKLNKCLEEIESLLEFCTIVGSVFLSSSALFLLFKALRGDGGEDGDDEN